MRALDTNVLVRLLAQDDARQLAVARQWVEQGVWVPTLALAEAMWVLSDIYGRGPTEIVAVIESLLDNGDMCFQDSDVVAAALAKFRKRPSVGFTDCLLLEMARKAGHLPLGTFDRSLSKLDGAQQL